MSTNETTYQTNGCAQKLTCFNLPLATAYVKSQPYQHLNTPLQTLYQGTFFADLYDPYMPRKVAQGGRRHE
ncbi:spore coat associated protein CotJA [Turicibacter sanguinis]|uniref:spore coat associated protein CotJA n=1 Tax=Turicibacter sanguinis TaxID=154288 RepID=UPI001E51F806|nr:spore coat associated protein CotJA [Turicibacter sanguinis]MDB8437389.1 spore coat associated protein CotJA [Turicibacter sanguinis]MDB8460294.1 spore coat associated protein CotJA [Turicibacter sanguinis]